MSLNERAAHQTTRHAIPGGGGRTLESRPAHAISIRVRGIFFGQKESIEAVLGNFLRRTKGEVAFDVL
jgi:hypothetical protein